MQGSADCGMQLDDQAMKPKPDSGWIAHNSSPNQIRLRELREGDCLEHLTGMLHRAFFRIGEMGIPCSCVNQAPEVTRQRVARGHCFVALSGELIVGTITLYASDARSDSAHYRDTRVASVRQLGVDPLFQGKGVGSALLGLAENRARRYGYAGLALDTPEPASHLIDYYQRQGFRIVETLQFAGRPYRSVVFAKSLREHSAARRARRMPGRRLTVAPIQRQRQTSTLRHGNRMPYCCCAQHSRCLVIGNYLPRKRR